MSKQPKYRKIALLGFTNHRAYAPYNDPEWAIWGLNDLYLDTPETVHVDRLEWFQVHGWEEIAKYKSVGVLSHPLNFAGGPPHPRDANHVAWMAAYAKVMPLWLMEPRPEVPDAKVYPKEEVFKYFSLDGKDPNFYFTNSISWMLAKAIMDLTYQDEDGKWRAVEGAEIGVWGVDMMMAGGPGSEYGYQRPSCEWLLGWARGLGIKVHIPKESDLLKTAFVYGDAKAAVYRTKLMEHLKELEQRLNGVRAQKAQLQAGEAELSGAINVLKWQLASWMPQDGDPENMGMMAPMPDAHKQQH